MYEEFLGQDYHEKIRKMLTADEALLPDRIIDADLNIGGMKKLISPALEKMKLFGRTINNDQKYNQLTNIAIYYLCGILCNAMKSRTSAPPYNVPRYRKKWDKKREGYMQKGNQPMNYRLS